MDKIIISSDDDYKYYGIIYKKVTINNINIFKTKKVTKCKIINGNAFEDEMENVYIKFISDSMDNDEEVIHFISSKSTISKVYEEKKDYFMVQYMEESGKIKVEFIEKNNLLNKELFHINSSNVNINIKELNEELNTTIINQKDAIQQILTILDLNNNLTNFRNKTNILLIGPSGSGKTEIFRTIAQKINVPITIEDSEQYSIVGYKGASITDMLINLYHNAHDNLKAAEHGIVVIDEIDKKITQDKEDVSGKRVLDSLLTIMEGANINISIDDDFRMKDIMFDTSHVTFALVGAFSDLIKKGTSIGFENNIENSTVSYNEIDENALIKYGMTPENIRRVSIFRLNRLNIDNFIEIMLTSKNSTLIEYKNYLSKKNIQLNISDNALKMIAEIAYRKNIGASGIKATLNDILLDAFFEILCNPNSFSSLDIDEDSLKEYPPYRLRRKR